MDFPRQTDTIFGDEDQKPSDMEQSIDTFIRESADRLAIRQLVDAYAFCADTRDAKGQMALFTPDTHFVVYMDSRSAQPSQELHSREALAPVFDNLNTYTATMHFNGQHSVQLAGATATGTTYCLAHHWTEKEGKRTRMVAAIRYLDTFVKEEGNWYFAQRKLMVQWIDS